MKEKSPYCPNCKTANYVVLDRTATQAGAALGGLMGASGVYAAKKAVVDPATTAVLGALCPVAAPVTVPAAILTTDLLLALIAGFSAGAATGVAVGEQIDGKIRGRYRCNACGTEIRG